MIDVPSIYTLYEITNLSKCILEKYPETTEEINIQGHIVYLYTRLKKTPLKNISIEDFIEFNKELNAIFENSNSNSNPSHKEISEMRESYYKMIDNSQYINCSSTRWTINLKRFKCVKKIYISNIYLSGINNIPQSLTHLISVNTFLKKIGDLPPGLKQLVCNNNCLERLPLLNNTSLELLCFSSNLIHTIPHLPSTLKCLIFNNNNVTTMPILPKQIQHLECNMNHIRQLPDLPESLVTLMCSHNFIMRLPCLSSLYFLKTIVCKSNNIMDLPPLPGLVEYLDYSDNPIEIFVPFPASLIA